MYWYRATKTQKQPSTMAPVVPQKPITLSSKVERKFMPKMPAIIAPMAAAKLAMESRSSRRLTCNKFRAAEQLSGDVGSRQVQTARPQVKQPKCITQMAIK